MAQLIIFGGKLAVIGNDELEKFSDNEETHMTSKFRSVILGVVLTVGISPAIAAQKEPIKFAHCSDQSNLHAFIQPQMVQAARDYAKLINQNGGIEGHPLEIIVQDTASEPQRSIECYESARRAGAVAFYYGNTPATMAMLRRQTQDQTVLNSLFVGAGAAVDGSVFNWVFPIGPTYFGQAANDIYYIKTQSNDSLEGVKIAFTYIDYSAGQEPISLLKELAEKEGFELGLFPYPLPGNDQGATWTRVRRFNPDWVINWGFSSMHVVAAREMRRNGIPMEKYIGMNWMNEADIENIGAEAATGIKRATNIVVGQDSPLIQQILTELYDEGQGSGDRKFVGDGYYNGGVANWAPFIEGARQAIREFGSPLTADKLRRGLEMLENFDANGLIAPVTITSEDHGGGGKTRIEMWDGSKWVPQTDWYSGYDDEVWSIVREQSSNFKIAE